MLLTTYKPIHNYPKHPNNIFHSVKYLHEIQYNVYMKYNITPNRMTTYLRKLIKYITSSPINT